jgi:hypothetical protein
MTMQYLRFLAAAFLLSFSPLAFADSLQFSVDSTIAVNIFSPNDNFYGTYTTTHPQVTDYPTLGTFGVSVAIPLESFSLPTGSVVTSESFQIIVPSQPITGTGYIFALGGFPPPELGMPSRAPTFTTTGSSEVYAEYVFGRIPFAIAGNEVTFGNSVVELDLQGQIKGFLLDPGMNWAGYLGGSGQVTIPYTVQADVTYTVVPVPEPSTFALVASGILGISNAFRRRFMGR